MSDASMQQRFDTMSTRTADRWSSMERRQRGVGAAPFVRPICARACTARVCASDVVLGGQPVCDKLLSHVDVECCCDGEEGQKCSNPTTESKPTNRTPLSRPIVCAAHSSSQTHCHQSQRKDGPSHRTSRQQQQQSSSSEVSSCRSRQPHHPDTTATCDGRRHSGAAAAGDWTIGALWLIRQRTQ